MRRRRAPEPVPSSPWPDCIVSKPRPEDWIAEHEQPPKWIDIRADLETWLAREAVRRWLVACDDWARENLTELPARNYGRPTPAGPSLVALMWAKVQRPAAGPRP